MCLSTAFLSLLSVASEGLLSPPHFVMYCGDEPVMHCCCPSQVDGCYLVGGVMRVLWRCIRGHTRPQAGADACCVQLRVIAPDLAHRVLEEHAERHRWPRTVTVKWRFRKAGHHRSGASQPLPVDARPGCSAHILVRPSVPLELP